MKTTPKIFIRVNGNSQTGMGHITRCLALSEMIREEYTVTFIITEKDKSIGHLINPYVDGVIVIKNDGVNNEWKQLHEYITTSDILVIDDYNFRSEYQKNIKQHLKCKLVAIDDLHAWHQYADVVINHAVGGIEDLYETENYTKLYCGLDYVLLRGPFREPVNKETINQPIRQPNSLFINFGASDSSNITEKVIAKLREHNPFADIHILTGSVNINLDRIKKLCSENNFNFHSNLSAEELAALLRKCEYAITAASGISIEALACGCKVYPVLTADNQKDILNFFQKLLETGTNDIDTINLEPHNFKATNINTEHVKTRYQSIFSELSHGI